MHSSHFVACILCVGGLQVQPSASMPLRHGVKCVALRGPSGSDFLPQLEMLDGLALPRSPPLLRFLLSPRDAPPAATAPFLVRWSAANAFSAGSGGSALREPPDLDALVGGLIASHSLNREQAAVLRRVSGWLQPSARSDGAMPMEPTATATPSPPPPPVLLVHGTFGAGKSKLLVSVLTFLRHALRGASRSGANGNAPVRVLLTALTNVAVDNVLEGVISRAEEEGEAPDVLRVGSLRRISQKVSPTALTSRDRAGDRAERSRV